MKFDSQQYRINVEETLRVEVNQKPIHDFINTTTILGSLMIDCKNHTSENISKILALRDSLGQ